MRSSPRRNGRRERKLVCTNALATRQSEFRFLDFSAGLDETLISISISRISRSKFLVLVSSWSRKIILQKSRSRLGLGKSFYRSLSLVSVSENHFSEVSVSSRVSGFRSKISRKFQKKSITKVLVLKV